MSEAIIFLKEFGAVIAAIGSFIGVISTTYAVIKGYTRGKENEKTNKTILEKIEENDIKQDARISSVETKQDAQHEQFNKMFIFLSDRDLAIKMKNKINCAISNTIKGHQVNNEELKTIFLAGGDALNYLIEDLLINNFFDYSVEFDTENFRLKAKSKLKEIKTRIQVDKLDVDSNFIHDLKFLIYNDLNTLITDLKDIKTGQYNGKSKTKFQDSFVNCAKNVVSSTTKLYKSFIELKNIA